MAFDSRRFASDIGELADQEGLPGLAAGVVIDGTTALLKGFGHADIEEGRPFTSGTPCRVASVSKTLAATVVMQLVEKGLLSLDTPMAEFRGPSRHREKPILVRHVLSHTSEGTPGEAYRYSGYAYADLTLVVEQVLGRPYPTVLQERILTPCGMDRTMPGQLCPGHGAVLCDLATAYEIVDGRPVRSAFPLWSPNWSENGEQQWVQVGCTPTQDPLRREILGEAYAPLNASQTSAGIVSTVDDLLRFDAAVDASERVSPETQQLMWTPGASSTGQALPYGLGWFVQHVGSDRLVWHYGEWLTMSALYLKLPDRRMTLILLANSGGLSVGYSLGAGDVIASPYARAFLDGVGCAR